MNASTNSIIRGLVLLNEKEVVLIKPDLFGEKKPLSLVEISYCILNETKLQPIKRFLQFRNDRYAITVTCLTKKTKPICQVFTNLVHGYNHIRNVHANGITCTRKFLHGIDSSKEIIWICESVCLFFCPVHGCLLSFIMLSCSLSCCTALIFFFIFAKADFVAQP